MFSNDLNIKFKNTLSNFGLKDFSSQGIIEFLNQMPSSDYQTFLNEFGKYNYLLVMHMYLRLPNIKSMIVKYCDTFSYNFNTLVSLLKNEERLLKFLYLEREYKLFYLFVSKTPNSLKKYFTSLSNLEKTNFFKVLSESIDNDQDKNSWKDIVIDIMYANLEIGVNDYEYIIKIFDELGLKQTLFPKKIITKEFFEYLIKKDKIPFKYLFLYDINYIEEQLKNNKEFQDNFISTFKSGDIYYTLKFKDSEYIFNLLKNNNVDSRIIFFFFSEFCFKKLNKNNIEREEIINYLCNKLELTENELMNKIYKIYKINRVLINSDFYVVKDNEFLLNFSLFHKKFEKIDIKWLARIMSDKNLTKFVSSYDEFQINVLSQILNKLESICMNTNSLIVNIIKNLNSNQYKELINNIGNKVLTDLEITNLILVLQGKNINKVASLDDLDISLSKDDSNDIEKLLLNIFGVDLKTAKQILVEFKQFESCLPGNKVETEIKNIYLLLFDLLNSNNSKEISFFYEKVIKETGFDKKKYFNLKLYLQGLITKEYDQTLFKVDKSKVTKRVNDVDVILLEDYKFNMLVHSTNAFYDNELQIHDLKKGWYSPNMREHSICNTYIGNDFIRPANFNSICFGFSNLEDASFVSSYTDDAWSDSLAFDLSSYTTKHQTPRNLIKNTKNMYSEVIIDRLLPNLEKRSPSYIVYFSKGGEGFEKDELFQNALKVAKDFKVPVVIVDRLKYAKREEMAFLELVNLFKTNPSLEILDEMMIKLKNNYLSCLLEVSRSISNFFSQDNVIDNVIAIYEIVKGLSNPDLMQEFLNLINYFPVELSLKERIKEDLELKQTKN